jgi:hypothetical protein
MSNEDIRIKAYDALQPSDYRDVERITIDQSDDHDGYEVTLRLMLRPVTVEDHRLALTFHGVVNLALTPPPRFALQLPFLTIRSISDLGWERIHYSVKDEENEVLSFLCESFDARVE